MNLGKNIYELRTAKKLSQGDLADLLDVSRQSVSKWETDSAIPDLEKLIKMCDIFEVTLDELTGREAIKENILVTVKKTERENAFSSSKIVGYILLASTLIASILLFVLSNRIEDFYIPFPILLSTLACSIICLCFKKNIGYWCLWAALGPISILSNYIIITNLLSIDIIIQFTQIYVYIFMALLAKRIFKGCAVQRSKKISVYIVLGYVAGISTWILCRVLLSYDFIISCFLNCMLYAALACFLPYSVVYIKSKK